MITCSHQGQATCDVSRYGYLYGPIQAPSERAFQGYYEVKEEAYSVLMLFGGTRGGVLTPIGSATITTTIDATS